MARFRMQQSAFHFGSMRVRAGETLADSSANSQPGDVVWTGLNVNTVPHGAVPIDASGTTMFNASRWAGTTWGWASGSASIDA